MMGLAVQNEEPFRLNLNVSLMCPECKDGMNIVEEFSSGDMVCGNCGKSLLDILTQASFSATES
jgi:transcription initiation factor TFIIB